MSTREARGVVVIGGYSAGLGAALADCLGQSGKTVVALSRSRPTEIVRNEGDAVQTCSPVHFMCDLADEEQVGTAVSTVESLHGPILAYVHNPAHLFVAPFLETPNAEFERAWRTTLIGAANCARAILPAMIARKHGTVIFSGATASTRGGAKFSAFASAKFALRGFAQSLAREFGPRGIHVAHVVIDGLIWDSKGVRARGCRREDCIHPADLAKAYQALIDQPSSAWTLELDVRPAVEKF